MYPTTLIAGLKALNSKPVLQLIGSGGFSKYKYMQGSYGCNNSYLQILYLQPAVSQFGNH